MAASGTQPKKMWQGENITYDNLTSGEHIAGTAIAALGTVDASLVKFKSRHTNTGTIYIGGVGVTIPNGTADAMSGWPLTAGEESPWIPISNLSKFYSIASVAAQSVIYWVLS
jgi:hypothetical protein